MADPQFLLGVALLGVAFISLLQRKPSTPLPPGPKGYPVIGNVFDMPTNHPWLTFADWGNKYGDIVYVNLLGKPLVILNSAKAAKSILEKKSAIYSDRPILQMGGELVGWSGTLALTPYGDRFREIRKHMYRFMGSKFLVAQHHEIMFAETHKSLRRILLGVEDIGNEIRNNAGAIILKVAYGYSVQEHSDPIVALVEKAVGTLELATTPGRWLVDSLPVLRHVPAWFPGAGFQKSASSMGKLVRDMAEVPYQLTMQKMRNNDKLPPNFLSELVDNLSDANDTLKWAAASLYSGGADTTVSALHSFVLAMVLHPDVQKRAQAEIDLIIGPDRLPTFEDRDQLPYIEAVVKEVFRWQPVAPLGLPHLAMQDDIHAGYFIPKGTTVFANIWSILHDPETYPNPEAFEPGRYVTEAGEPTSVPDAYEVCFGYGRRSCPGTHFADASVFISCAMMLSVFDISKAVENGRIIEPAKEYTAGAISHPKPFQCTIKPRSAKAEQLIKSEMV